MLLPLDLFLILFFTLNIPEHGSVLLVFGRMASPYRIGFSAHGPALPPWLFGV